MRELITKINREKGYTYKVDKQGNIFKESYNWFKDPYTLVAIAIILLATMYYFQVSQMKTTEKNFESTCLHYINLREQWMKTNPGKIPTLEEVFNYKPDDMVDIQIESGT